MSQQKPHLIVKIRSSLRTAIFDCEFIVTDKLFNCSS